MAKNYDNWERLVRVVLRRELDKQIALRDSSFSSSTSSTLPSASIHFSFGLTSGLFDQNSIAGWKIPHTDWKALLPAGQNEVVWTSSALRFFVDKSTGKICFMLGSEKLAFAIGQLYGDYWTSIRHYKSRFHEAAELSNSSMLYIRAIIKAEMLFPDTLYAVYLVFRVTADSGGKKDWESPKGVVESLDYDVSSDCDYSEEHFSPRKSRIVEDAVLREDEWLEVKMGDIYVLEEDMDVDMALVEVTFWEMADYEKIGTIVVEGIEFRPSTRTPTSPTLIDAIGCRQSTNRKPDHESKRSRRGGKLGLFSSFWKSSSS